MERSKINFNKRIAIFGLFLSLRSNYRAPCEDLAEKLESRKWEVIKASDRSKKASRLVDMLSTAWKMRHEYELGAIEVYSGQAFLWAEAVSFALKCAQKPYILTLHGGSLPEFAKKWTFRVKRLLESAAKVTTPSLYLSQKMRSFRDDMILIPNPIDIAAYHFSLREKVTPKLVWLRKFREIYNPFMAPKVISLVLKRNLSVRLSMMGPDSGDGSFQMTKDLAGRYNVLDRIDFRDGVPKERVPLKLEPHDIFINTTNIDNTPITVLEAMACGLCVVSTNVGGIPYLLEHEKDALLVPPNDPEAMANCVHRIINEPGLSARLSQNARAKAKNFSWERVLPMWEELLKTVITGRDDESLYIS